MANMFNEDGTYNKTEWKAGDKITAVKLNKIELSLEAINNNDIDRHVEADSRLDILEETIENSATKNELKILETLVKENKDNTDLDLLNMVENIDKTIHSEIDKLGNEVSEELEVVNSQLEHNMKNINELGQIVNKDYGDGITDASEYIQNLINNSGGGVVYIPYPSKFYLLKSKITTKWTNFGTRIEMQGSPRMGASAFQIDDSFTDDCVFEISHDAVMLKNVGISNSGSKKVIGIKINNGAKWVRLYNCGITGFHMGVSYATYYASFTDCLFYNNDYGIYVGNPNGSCGSLSIYGGHLRNNGVNELENGSAVYLQKGTGICNGIAFYGTTFETNRRHVKNDGGSILLDCCYLGDGCATECIENINGTTTIDGKFVQACGGAGSHHFIETTDITVFGCGVKVSGGNVNLNNLSLSQNIHCSEGIINGSAASGTDIMLIDGTVSTNNVTSNDHCQATILKNSGNKMQLVKSYIKGGDLSDKNKIYTTFPVVTEGKENGYGGNILTLSNDGSITAALIVRFDFEIPEYYVNKTMYCVMVLGKQSGAYNPRLSPVTNSFITDTSAPFIGNTSLVEDNFSCAGVNNSTTYDNCVRIFYLPIKPLVTTGKIEYRFSYPTSTGNKSMELYGCFLVDEKYKGILAKYHE